MQQSLSFTIPYTSSAIRATVTALNQMDNDLNGTVGLFEQAVSIPTSIKPSGVEYVTVTTDIPTPPHVTASMDTPPPPVEAEEPTQVEGAVDARGLLWDERIHASTKTFVANGTWKMKRGVDEALVDQVMSELMGNAPVDTLPTQNSVNTPLPPVEAIVETTTEANPNAFRQLLSEITKAGLAPDYVQTTCREVNGCTLPECKDDMDKLAMLRMSLGL